VTAAAVVIVARKAQPDSDERALQTELGLPLVAPGQEIDTPCYLRLDEGRLTLFRSDEKTRGVAVDFASAALTRRRRQGLSGQGLGKAVGLKGGRRPQVLDATAGLGSDAFLLAAHGCRVTACERDPVVAALLRDGIRRAEADERLAPIMTRMTLSAGDVREMDWGPATFEIVYLDPMFPPSGNSARVKKAMSALQRLLGEYAANEGLLSLARSLASQRVVVKRGRHSPALEATTPDLSFTGRSSRYDVYFTPRE